MATAPFSLRHRLRSFGYALNGLLILLREEHNARLHLLGAVLAVTGALFLHLSRLEWILIFLCIGMVFILEIINSAVERLADHISPGRHQLIGQVKDLCAGAVLVGATTAFAVGAIIFIPKIFQLIRHVV